MPQLVGKNCVHCQQRIISIRHGRFCELCGNPIHAKCVPEAKTGCANCGAEPGIGRPPDWKQGLAKPSIVQSSAIRVGPAPAKPVEADMEAPPPPEGGWPESEICPACGSSEYRKVAPNRWIFLLVSDRICKKCRTRFIPPPPNWAIYLAILTALFMIVVSTSDLSWGLTHRREGYFFGAFASGAIGLVYLVFALNKLAKSRPASAPSEFTRSANADWVAQVCVTLGFAGIAGAVLNAFWAVEEGAKYLSFALLSGLVGVVFLFYGLKKRPGSLADEEEQARSNDQ